MKTIIIVIASLLFTTLLVAQPSNITGTTTSNQIKKVSLLKVLNGRLVEIATANPDNQGRFGFRFTPEYEGFYCIGYGPIQFTHATHKFYFKGSEELEIKLSPESYELISTNSEENTVLYKWYLHTKEIAIKSLLLGSNSTYVDFFPQIEELNLKINDWKKNPKTKNEVFNQLYPTIVDYDFAFYAISYLYMPRSAHNSKEEFTDYYNKFNPDNYLTDKLLILPYGDRFMNSLVNKKVVGTGKITTDILIESIPVDVLKGQFALNMLERSKTFDEFKATNEKYSKYFSLPEQLERVKNTELKLVDTKSGGAAFNFNFPDATGKSVSLKDLKGKVVLIDMWATWCGPCRAEEPYWEKLNDEYAGKPVAFVGVSTDKDKEAWNTYLKEKKLKGIQLHAGVGNPLSQAYQVNSIPRYILIDKNGNLITADSPRPSDPKLKDLLNTWLNK